LHIAPACERARQRPRRRGRRTFLEFLRIRHIPSKNISPANSMSMRHRQSQGLFESACVCGFVKNALRAERMPISMASWRTARSAPECRCVVQAFNHVSGADMVLVRKWCSAGRDQASLDTRLGWRACILRLCRSACANALLRGDVGEFSRGHSENALS